MKRTELKQIGDYVKDMEEGLVEWDGDRFSLQVDLAELHRVIDRLTQTASESTNPDLLVQKAKEIRQAIVKMVRYWLF